MFIASECKLSPWEAWVNEARPGISEVGAPCTDSWLQQPSPVQQAMPK